MSLARALVLSRAPVLPFMVMGAGWGTFAAYVPELKAGLGVSDGLFGLVLMCSSIGLLSALWAAPRLDAQLGPRALPLAAAFLGLAFVLPGIAGTVALFAVAMMVMGAASGLCDVVMNTRVSELEARHGVTLMNLNHAMFSFAYAVFALVCAFTREAGLPPIVVLGVVTLIGLCLAPLTYGIYADEDAAQATRTPLPLGFVIAGGVIVLLAFMVENAMEGWSALHLERTLGGRPAEGAQGPMVLGLMMGIGRLSGQVFSNRVPDGPMLVGGAILSAIGFALVAGAGSVFGAYVGFGLAGLGVSVIAPIALGIIGRGVRPSARSRAMALATVIGFMGFFVGPSAMGGLSQAFGLRVAFAAAGIAVLAVPAVLYIMRSRASALQSPQAPEERRDPAS